MKSDTPLPGPPFRSVRLVVFDLDGTLVDAFEDIAAAVNHMLAHFGREAMTVEAVKRHVGRGVHELIAGVLGSRDEALLRRGVDAMTEYYHEHPARLARVYDGVVETLKKLRAHGIRTAVASNKPHALTKKVLEHLGVAELLDDIHGQSDRFPRKPSPDLLQHLMTAAGTDADMTLLVGDSPTDIEFARAAGVPVVVVTHGQCSAEELQGHAPDAVIATMPGLLPLILG